MKVSLKDFITAVKMYGPDRKTIRDGIMKDHNVKFSLHNISERMARARKKGQLPLESGNKVQDGSILKGTSTLYDADGNVKIQWVKTDTHKDNELEHFQMAIDELTSNLEVHYVPAKRKHIKYDKDTMTIYSIGDAHIGLLAWGEEVGEDYDSDKAVADLLTAVDLLVKQAYPSKEALIIDVGDYYHMDSQASTTTAGTRVDVDTRFTKMVETGLRLAVDLITRALQKHRIVRWRSAIGNHNSHSAIYVTSFLKAWFKDEPRVIIHDTPSMFMYHQFGKNLIGITHGHTVKAEKLGEIMSVDCKDQWSTTDHRYW